MGAAKQTIFRRKNNSPKISANFDRRKLYKINRELYNDGDETSCISGKE